MKNVPSILLLAILTALAPWGIIYLIENINNEPTIKVYDNQTCAPPPACECQDAAELERELSKCRTVSKVLEEMAVQCTAHELRIKNGAK